MRPTAARPTRPGWTVRVVPNLYPALTPDAPEPEPHANPDLFTAQPAAGHHEVIVNAPDPVTSLVRPRRRTRSQPRWRRGASACARTRTAPAGT